MSGLNTSKLGVPFRLPPSFRIAIPYPTGTPGQATAPSNSVTVGATVLASETARRLSPPRRDVQTKGSFPHSGPAINTSEHAQAANLSHSRRCMRRRYTEWQLASHRHGSTGRMERDGRQDHSRGGRTSGYRILNLARSRFIPPLLAITYNETASVRKHNDSSLLIQRAARPRATIVPHTLLLGQSGNAKQGSNRF